MGTTVPDFLGAGTAPMTEFVGKHRHDMQGGTFPKLEESGGGASR